MNSGQHCKDNIRFFLNIYCYILFFLLFVTFWFILSYALFSVCNNDFDVFYDSVSKSEYPYFFLVTTTWLIHRCWTSGVVAWKLLHHCLKSSVAASLLETFCYYFKATSLLLKICRYFLDTASSLLVYQKVILTPKPHISL